MPKNCGNRAIRRQAHRIETQIERDLRESAQEFGSVVNLESFVHYFYPQTESFLEFFHPETTAVFLDEPQHLSETANALETEFRESMTGPSGKRLYPAGTGAASVPRKGNRREAVAVCGQCHSPRWMQRAACLSRIAGLKSRCAACRSYNNSFEALLKDLKRYKKKWQQGAFVMCIPGRGRSRLAADLREQELSAFVQRRP